MIALLSAQLPLAASQPVGVAISLFTAVMWAISPICFAAAGRRIGSFPVVVMRTAAAALLMLLALPLYLALAAHDAHAPSPEQIAWLVLSGAFGMVLGDALAYESLVRIGPRRTSQILTLAPVAAVVPAWLWLGEALRWRTLLGIALVIVGTSYAVLRRPAENREPGRVSVGGIVLAACGAVLVGLGAVAVRQAFLLEPALDPVVASAVRVTASGIMFLLVAAPRLPQMVSSVGERGVLSRFAPGVLVGPFAGILGYSFALQQLPAGIVSTLTSISPLVMIPMVAARYRTRIGADIVLAAALAIAGVTLITLH